MLRDHQPQHIVKVTSSSKCACAPAHVSTCWQVEQFRVRDAFERLEVAEGRPADMMLALGGSCAPPFPPYLVHHPLRDCTPACEAEGLPLLVEQC
jgi:hypothetical protein